MHRDNGTRLLGEGLLHLRRLALPSHRRLPLSWFHSTLAYAQPAPARRNRRRFAASPDPRRCRCRRRRHHRVASSLGVRTHVTVDVAKRRARAGTAERIGLGAGFVASNLGVEPRLLCGLPLTHLRPRDDGMGKWRDLRRVWSKGSRVPRAPLHVASRAPRHIPSCPSAASQEVRGAHGRIVLTVCREPPRPRRERTLAEAAAPRPTSAGTHRRNRCRPPSHPGARHDGRPGASAGASPRPELRAQPRTPAADAAALPRLPPLPPPTPHGLPLGRRHPKRRDARERHLSHRGDARGSPARAADARAAALRAPPRTPAAAAAAPLSNTSRAASTWPSWQATYSGVIPSLSAGSTAAPLSSSSRTVWA